MMWRWLAEDRVIRLVVQLAPGVGWLWGRGRWVRGWRLSGGRAVVRYGR